MSSSKLKYFSIGKTIDGTNYCSGVESYVDNIIESNEEDAVLIFPSENGWAGLRSSSYKLTTDNAEAVLPLPIYKVKKVLLKPFVEYIDFEVAAEDDYGAYYKTVTLNVSEFTDEKGNKFELDITDMVIPEEEWKSLFISKSAEEYQAGIYKDNTFYWSKGSNTIPFVGQIYKIGSGSFANEEPVYKRLRARLSKKLQGSKWSYTFPAGSFNWSDAQTVSLDDFITKIIYGKDEAEVTKNNDVRRWQYRIEYIPLTSKTKIRARKSEKQEVEYVQPFNQRAEVNAASAFGQNMWLTAQKTGVRQITVVKNYTKLLDIPPLGSLVIHNGKKYRLIANSYNQTNTIYIRVTHTLSENWTSKSKHVSVDQKYRNYSIPQDILWRNLYWEDYVVVSGGTNYNGMPGVDISKVASIFAVDSTNDKTINYLCWMFEGKDEGNLKQIGAAVPCSTYGIANSIVISATFKDNLSAGLKTAVNETNDDSVYLCEETLYCNQDGTLGSAIVILSDGIGNGVYSLNSGLTENQDEALSGNARLLFPAIIQSKINEQNGQRAVNAPETALFKREFYIDKDPGEALKFTYQVHFVSDNDCVVGNKIAENNPLIKRYTTSRQFKVWLLKSHIREGVDKLETTDSDVSFTQTSDGKYFTCTPKEGQPAVTIALNKATRWELINKLNGYKAWAITDENNNLYVGRNENEDGYLYLCLSHKRP